VRVMLQDKDGTELLEGEVRWRAVLQGDAGKWQVNSTAGIQAGAPMWSGSDPPAMGSSSADRCRASRVCLSHQVVGVPLSEAARGCGGGRRDTPRRAACRGGDHASNA
jgi:hypothetical protein